VNIKEEYSDPSDYSSDTCSDLDWTSRSATANSASSSASGLADLRHGTNCSLCYTVSTTSNTVSGVSRISIGGGAERGGCASPSPE